jgi:hypothetical protein
VEHALGMRGVTADREVCLAIGLREVGVRRHRHPVPEPVDHAVAAVRRGRDDESTDRGRMPDGQLHRDLTAVAEPEHVDRPDGELRQQRGDAVRRSLERRGPVTRTGAPVPLQLDGEQPA